MHFVTFGEGSCSRPRIGAGGSAAATKSNEMARGEIPGPYSLEHVREQPVRAEPDSKMATGQRQHPRHQEIAYRRPL